MRRVWIADGFQPVARFHWRFQWLWLYGFVHPESGKTYWWILPKVNIKLFNRVLADFAQHFGVGKYKRIVLAIDQAGWHTSELVEVPLMHSSSSGRFGFSIQKRIWQSVGGKPNASWETYCRFGERVGWRVRNRWLDEWNLTYTLAAPIGHLPALGEDSSRITVHLRGVGDVLFSRLHACQL